MAFGRKRSGSVLCPGCGQLVGVRDDRCLSCDRRNPGLFGFAGMLRFDGPAVQSALIGANAVLFLVALLLSGSRIGMGGFLGFLSPDTEVLYWLGASGAVPIFMAQKWYTVLSAGWLHGGLLHILLNMYWLWNLFPAVSREFGPARTLVIYQAAAIGGFGLSSLLGAFPISIPGLGGAGFTVGASASVCGLLGALLYVGRRTSSAFARMIWRYVIFLAVFGLLIPGIDNAAHLGGFGGGYFVASRFGVFGAERGRHGLWALGLLAGSVLAVLVSATR